MTGKADVNGAAEADRLLNSRAAAQYLGYEVGTLYNKVFNGEIEPTLRTPTGRLRFSVRDLDKFLGRPGETSSEEVAA